MQRMDDRAEVISTPLQYALRYVALGWPVFACRENDKRPIAQGGFHTASIERSEVIATWQQHPRANVGIPAGRAWWVLDVDPRHGGNETLAALEDCYGELPQTLMARTPSGGTHFYFAPDGRARNSTSKLGPGLDTRGDGGYVLVEGSSIAGLRYQYQDWDPLTEPTPAIAPAPEWLMQAAFGTPKQRESAAFNVTELTVGEGGRNHFLTRQGGRLRRMGYGHAEILAALRALNETRCRPPLEDDEVQTVATSVARYAPGTLEVPRDEPPPVPEHLQELPPVGAYEQAAQVPMPEEREDGVPKAAAPARNIINWRDLSTRKAPKRAWLLDQWLGYTPTLFAGRGGIGKTLLSQQVATCLATRRNLFRLPEREIRVLCWYCEDEHDELWRRQEDICAWLGMTLDQLESNFVIDARRGLENTLYSTEYGRPMWTPLIAELEQEIGDYRADIVMLDNIGHIYGANENDRHHVTAFVNGITGLARDHQFCPMFIGHPAKDSKSEYAGNAAWENSVRMRWFMSDRLPDEPVPDDEEEQTDQSLRFLCKRKANYSRKDYIRFKLDGGVLIPEEQSTEASPPDVVDALYNKRAETAVLDGLRRVQGMGKTSSDTPGPSYLPKQLVQHGLTGGLSKRELEQAMRRLMTSGSIKRAEVGRYANRTPKFGLVEVK